MKDRIREIEEEIVTAEFWLRMAWRARRLAQCEELHCELSEATRAVRLHLIRLNRLHCVLNFERCLENVKSI